MIQLANVENREMNWAEKRIESLEQFVNQNLSSVQSFKELACRFNRVVGQKPDFSNVPPHVSKPWLKYFSPHILKITEVSAFLII